MIVAVVLAAGVSKRFGSNKLLALLPNGDRLIDRVLRAAAIYTPCVVVSPALTSSIETSASIVVNERPELGMAYSLQLADRQIAPAASLLILPADLALIEPQYVALVAASSDGYDVTYPRNSEGVPGHPAIFSARARTFIATLVPGEPISAVRDRPDLKRRVLPIEDPWPYRDVDRREDLASL